MSGSPIPELLRRMNAQTLDALAVSAAIKQGPESGRARENAIRAFLRPLMPDALGLSTGFVIDASGQVSQQQDIVIYRRDYHPVFVINDIRYFMVEAVVAVIQCRSRLTSAAAVRSALENLISVKTLDRTDGGRNYLVIGTGRGPQVNPDEYYNQVFAAVVTERSMDPSLLVHTWRDVVAPHPRRAWPNLYVDVHRLTVHYMPVSADRVTFRPHDAEHVAWSVARPDSPPLVLLAHQLMSLARVTPVIDFQVERYLPPANFGPGQSIHVNLDDMRHPPGQT
jgi:hypothetical protein